MKRLTLFAALALCCAAPSITSAQEPVGPWGAMSESSLGETWVAKGYVNPRDALNSAQASCWNNSKIPASCMALVGNAWLAAVRCVHKTKRNFVFTRYGIAAGSDEAEARQKAINSQTKDGNVSADDCVIHAAVNVGAEEKPQESARKLGQQ